MRTITKRAANGMFIDLEQTKGGNWTFSISTATGVTVYASCNSFVSLYQAYHTAYAVSINTKG